jgi:hypothetical protein
VLRNIQAYLTLCTHALVCLVFSSLDSWLSSRRSFQGKLWRQCTYVLPSTAIIEPQHTTPGFWVLGQGERCPQSRHPLLHFHVPPPNDRTSSWMGSRDAPETLVSVDGGDQCSLVSEKNRTWFISIDKYDKVGCNERDGVRSSADKTQMSETVRETSETGSGDAWRWRERGT